MLKRAFLLTFFFLLLISTSFAAGYLANDYLGPRDKDWPILEQAYEILLKNGLKDPPPDPALEYGMIRGMLQAYNDPYTMFVDPPQHELQTNTLQGSFGGIGADMGLDAQGSLVLYPYPGGPAEEAGLKEGDRLLTVDKLAVQQQTPRDTVEAALRGPVGKAVRVTIGRPPEYTPQEFSIIRKEFPLPSVTWRLDSREPRLGVIKINLIATSTPDEVRKAVEDLAARGATAYLLDLRDNYGGVLAAGVDVARLFLKKGAVMEQQYRGREIESYRAEKDGPFSSLPLAVLINENTASAAEIIAGALQARGRARLFGSRSYGKDSIQLVFSLSDGSSLHVTAAQWWIPGLKQPISGAGLQPDNPIEQSQAANEPAVQAAIQALFGNK